MVAKDAGKRDPNVRETGRALGAGPTQATARASHLKTGKPIFCHTFCDPHEPTVVSCCDKWKREQ